MRGVALLITVLYGEALAEPFLWAPLENLIITCDFCGYHNSPGVCHGGIDFRARNPITVVAAAAGLVEKIINKFPDKRNDAAGFGNHLVLLHPNGYRTIYAHLTRNSFMVMQGASVEAGQQLAISDTSGRARGPHLHFEVKNPQGQRVDPYGDYTDQNKCVPEYQNIPHTCGPQALWATCPPTPYMPPPAPDAAVADGAVVWPDGPLAPAPDAAVPDGVVVWPDGMMVWPDGPVFPDASAPPDGNVQPPDASIDGPLPPAPDAAVPDAFLPDAQTPDAPNSNPCLGVSCNAPPVPWCVNATTRRTYASQGICVDGTCSYNAIDTVCTDGNSCTADSCANSACAYSAIVPCCGNNACGGNETVCTCPTDCASWCGDNCCSGAETCLNCENDCGCSSSEVCLNATESCGADSTPTTISYRFVNLCTSAHWQSIGESCYPGSSGPTQGCGGCGATIVNSGCGSATCWDRELSFPTYLLEPGYGQFSQIFHCFESGANSYSRNGCASYGDPTSIGWIADASVGDWTRPLYLCQWNTGIVTEQFFSWNCNQEADGGNPVTTLNPSPYGRVP